jgi:hypothetical protein
MPAEPADANELADLEKLEATIAARRDALAQKFGEGAVVMTQPGAPNILFVRKGKLIAVKVTYLTGGGS